MKQIITAYMIRVWVPENIFEIIVLILCDYQ